MRLWLNVDHADGTVEWDSKDPFRFEAAINAFHAFAYAQNGGTTIKLPTRDGAVTVVKAADIDRFDLTWEA